MRSSELAVGFCVGGFQRIHDFSNGNKVIWF